MNYPENYINQIIQGNCIEIIKEIPNNLIDLIFTDPPYVLDWKDPIKFKERKDIFHHKLETEKWDCGDINQLYLDIASEFNRVLKEGGSVLIFCRVENISYVKKIFIENGFFYKATIMWHKKNPAPQVRKKNYVSSYETLCWLVKGFDEDKIRYTFNFKTQNEMHNFIEMPICMGKERTDHPTQKPIKLIKHYLEIHSNENDLVLDPFIGVGTTALACKMDNRRYIGIEIDKRYCEMAEKRIKDYDSQLKLF